MKIFSLWVKLSVFFFIFIGCNSRHPTSPGGEDDFGWHHHEGYMVRVEAFSPSPVITPNPMNLKVGEIAYAAIRGGKLPYKVSVPMNGNAGIVSLELERDTIRVMGRAAGHAEFFIWNKDSTKIPGLVAFHVYVDSI